MILKNNDDIEINVNCFEALGDVKGVVQIAHGMSEHCGRYADFARFLNSHGYIVYANDHRGHGKSVKSKYELGIIADEAGFSKMVDDMYMLTLYIKKTHPDLPLFLFGHSMGSFLSQRYIMLHGDELSGVILSGSNGKNPKILSYIANKIARSEERKLGRNVPSVKMDKLLFGQFNSKFKPNRTPFDWLSRDEAEVDKYINDPLCGFIFSAGAYRDLLDGLSLIEDRKNVANVPKNLPIFIISGTKDPVGNFKKGLIKLKNTYDSMGINSVKMKLYEGARHELLNETNREEVYKDVVEFIDSNLIER